MASAENPRPLQHRNTVSATIVDELPKARSSAELVQWCIAVADRLDAEQAQAQAAPAAEPPTAFDASRIDELEQQLEAGAVIVREQGEKLALLESIVGPLLALKGDVIALIGNPAITDASDVNEIRVALANA